MGQEFKRIHFVTAGVAFAVAFITYLLTMQPTIPFWDCGEFIAGAAQLQVSHPPGAPFWMLLGHVGAWLVPVADLAARYNVLSALCGSLSAMLLYLVAVKVIRLWRGEPRSSADAIIHFSGALIAALSFTWSDSVWFNSGEFIVFSPGLLFIALMIWIAMIWQEKADQPGNERYLMLIAFFIGLSMGAHQMSMLAFFPVWAIVFYRHWKNVTMRHFLAMLGLGILFFAFVFKIVLNGLVGWAASGLGILAMLVILGIIGGIYYTSRTKTESQARRGFLNLLLWGGAMVLLGYTVYGYAMIRGAQNPPMNEGAPTTFSTLSEYISRTQYGTVSFSDEFIHRRLPQQKEDHANTWNNYTSDGDFFWRYQTNWMFNRYLGWNFIGRDGDYMGAGVDPSKTCALPFALGLFGIYWHFKRDPKRALTFLAAFLIMGLFTDWYQNQQDPQPRERDYFYVGAFWVFAMWVGIGALGVMEFMREKWASMDQRKLTFALGSLAALLLMLGPVNQCVGLAGLASGESFEKSSKWAEYSRKNNWVPWEYAYNILQSCEKDAILFTYGDNDTFPLWCMQDLYGIRRDVRIIQLQLATMMWNVRQIAQKNDWGADGVRLQIFTPQRIALSSDNETYEAVQQDRDWKAPFVIPVSDETAKAIAGDSSAIATTMTWTPKISNYSDFLVADIISSNLNTRPIFYSVTVPENSRAGLNKFLIYEGLVARVTPFQQPEDQTGLAGSVQPARYNAMMLTHTDKPHSEPYRGLILTSYANPNSHLSGMDEDYSMTYRYDFMRLADWNLNHGDPMGARRALDTMEALIPVNRLPMDFSFAAYISDLADRAGNWTITQKYAAYGAKKLREQMQSPDWTESNAQSRPDYQLANLEMRAGEFARARKDFEAIRNQTKPDQQAFVALKIAEVDARRLESEKKYDSAYRKFDEIIHSYGPSSSPGSDLQDLQNHAWFDSTNMAKVH